MPDAGQSLTDGKDRSRIEAALAKNARKIPDRLLRLRNGSVVRACLGALDATINPFSLQVRYLLPGYAKKPLTARSRAVAATCGLALLPVATYLAANLGLAIPVTVPLFLGLCVGNIAYKAIIRKKSDMVIEETNAAGQRVSGHAEDLCALALTQKLIDRLSDRFNRYAVPPLITHLVDFVIDASGDRRARVSVIDAGTKGASDASYDFAGHASSKSQMRDVAALMTEGAPRDVRVKPPLRLKKRQAETLP